MGRPHEKAMVDFNPALLLLPFLSPLRFAPLDEEGTALPSRVPLRKRIEQGIGLPVEFQENAGLAEIEIVVFGLRSVGKLAVQIVPRRPRILSGTRVVKEALCESQLIIEVRGRKLGRLLEGLVHERPCRILRQNPFTSQVFFEKE